MLKSIENMQSILPNNSNVTVLELDYVDNVTKLIKQQTAIYSIIENQINEMFKYAHDNTINVPRFSSYSDSLSKELATYTSQRT